MKTVSWRITYDEGTSILNQLIARGFMPLEIQGSLIDNYICEIGEWKKHRLKLGRFKLRKYLLIREVYETEWSSRWELELTDDDSVYEAWLKHWENQMKGESA